MNSMQLLYYQAPISAAILFLPVLLVEPFAQVIFRSWSFTEIVSRIYLGCIFSGFIIAGIDISGSSG